MLKGSLTTDKVHNPGFLAEINKISSPSSKKHYLIKSNFGDTVFWQLVKFQNAGFTINTGGRSKRLTPK